ncbi:Concanavalin A-like lectin glucanase [Cordyceps militaris]|uniref:Concanavalin A-like lectin glucanase n=1 Tax=Cordyceps militaris TaxID=73501 RepID=A0A2H4STY1_CORMI|nr:Concanavalin A-like lectin glucanase [Cordyceps militaris]
MLLQTLLLVPAVAALATRGPERSHVRRDFISNNWCGQVLSGSAIRDVSASWVVPAASPLRSQNHGQPVHNYQWVGIDGATAECQAILQAGTYARLEKNRLTYGFWYEFYPLNSWLMDEPVVRPGDTVFVQVTAHNSTSGTAYMENRTTGQKATIALNAPAGSALCGSTAEWIQEDATGGLAPFNTFSFDECRATEAGGHVRTLEGSERWFLRPADHTLCYPSDVARDSVRINYSGPLA